MDIVALTCDVEWAPDFAIEYVAGIFEKYGVASTWFVTHESAGVKELQKRKDLFECGIHPNFLSGSTQGATETEVLTYVKKVVPNAKAVRTHSLFQSTRLMKKMMLDFGVEIDVSIFLPRCPSIAPHGIRYDRSSKELVRIPYFWEDAVEWFAAVPSWDFPEEQHTAAGIRIFNFHPLYVYANIEQAERYSAVKARGDYSKLGKNDIEPLINTTNRGPRQLLEDLCGYISGVQRRSYTISEIVDAWRAA